MWQVGRPATGKPRATHRTPTYDFGVTLRDVEHAEIISLKEIERY
jgi:hypothetical protein